VTFELPGDAQEVLEDINLNRNDYLDPSGTSEPIRVPRTSNLSRILSTKMWKAELAPPPEGILCYSHLLFVKKCANYWYIYAQLNF